MPSASQAAQSNREPPRGDLIFAVDTGGTKTAAWLVEVVDEDEHRLLGQARTSAGNPLSVGFDNAIQAIHEAFSAVRKSANCGSQRADLAVLSIAGAANPSVAQQFGEWALAAGVAGRVAIVSDVLPILAAGTPECCGVALIAGTGSSAYGRAADGQTKRCGGWGYLLGDEGSGYALGRAALQQTLRVLEHGSPPSGVAKALLKTLAVNSVTELTRAIYGSVNPRLTIAALAPLVSAAADNDEPVAVQILADAATALANLALRAAGAVGLKDCGFPLAISGGVLINSPRLQQLLQAELNRQNVHCEINIVREPLAGCVRLAHPKFATTLVEWHSK